MSLRAAQGMPCPCLGKPLTSAQLSRSILRAHLPCSACPGFFPCPCFWSENLISQQGLLLMSSPSHLTLLEEFLANKAPGTCWPLFFFLLLIRSLSLAQESSSSGKAGMSFLNCVYLLALWCESAPRQLHINLVSSLYLFSSASFPWPNLWLSFPLLPIVTMTGSGALSDGCSGLRQTGDLPS